MTFLRKYKALMLLIVFMPASVIAAESQQPSNDSSKQQDEQRKAQSTLSPAQVGALYRDNCAICHGDNGDANTRAQSGLRPPPRNFTTASAAVELSRERMILSVAEGRPGTGMMPHKDRMSSQEIEAVVDYIRDNFMMKTQNTDNTLVSHAKGEVVYTKYCAVCHGDKGTTAVWARSGLNPQPRDFGSPQSIAELTRERMINSVANGRPGTAMMPHNRRLTGQEIVEVVDYIRAAFMQKTAEAQDPAKAQTTQPAVSREPVTSAAPQLAQGAHPQVPGYNDPHAQMPMRGNAGAMRANPHQGPHTGMRNMPGMQAAMPPIVDADMTVGMPKGLTGDFTAGREFYMKNCFECHGVKGDGNGPRAYFNTPRPRDFTSDASTRMLNRERIFESVTNGKVGTVMPAWGRVLTDQQIANVSEFVFKAYITGGGSAGEDGNKKKAN